MRKQVLNLGCLVVFFMLLQHVGLCLSAQTPTVGTYSYPTITPPPSTTAVPSALVPTGAPASMPQVGLPSTLPATPFTVPASVSQVGLSSTLPATSSTIPASTPQVGSSVGVQTPGLPSGAFLPSGATATAVTPASTPTSSSATIPPKAPAFPSIPAGTTGFSSGFFQQSTPSYTPTTTPTTTPVSPTAPVVLSAEKVPATPTVQRLPKLPSAQRAKEEAESIKGDKPIENKVIAAELKGIDTLEADDSGGNWLIKRMWWEKAEEKMDRIEEEVDNIMDSRMAFFKKRDKADSQLFDPFYVEIGFDQGQLEEISSTLLDDLKEKKRKYESLERQERVVQRKIKAQKKMLKQLKTDASAIRKLDESIDEALEKVVEEINRARKYKKEARRLFKEIGRVLDHEKARSLYYKMDASWQSIKGISGYISGAFTNHFEKIIQTASSQVNRIKKAMDDLEKQGLSFKKQLKKMKNKDEKELEAQKEREEKIEEQNIEEQGGWFNGIITKIISPFYMLWNWISSWWSSSDENQDDQEKETSTEQEPIENEEPEVKELESDKVEPSVEEISQKQSLTMEPKTELQVSTSQKEEKKSVPALVETTSDMAQEVLSSTEPFAEMLPVGKVPMSQSPAVMPEGVTK